MAPKISSCLMASKVFASFAGNQQPWCLSRTLESGNRFDLQGELRGTAAFKENAKGDLVYEEEGSMGNEAGNIAGSRWSRKYIWRLSQPKHETTMSKVESNHQDTHLSVWFAKPPQRPLGSSELNVLPNDTEEDYIFHQLEFINGDTGKEECDEPQSSGTDDARRLIPPSIFESPTKVLIAHGHHLCVNDTYKTTYAFRVSEGDILHVMSWASKHAVHGPKKNQTIVNMYSRCGDD